MGKMVKSKQESHRPPVLAFTRKHGGKSSSAQRGDLHGGALVNIVTALIILGLIGLGFWWLIKSFGQAGQQYTQTMIDTKYTAITVKCQTNLRTIWQNLQMYAVANGSFPSSSKALVEWCGNSRLFRCPASDGQKYVYIPGQSGDLPPQNVLVYEPGAVHDGRCSVLLLGGQIGLVTPEELKVAVARTLANLKRVNNTSMPIYSMSEQS